MNCWPTMPVAPRIPTSIDGMCAPLPVFVAFVPVKPFVFFVVKKKAGAA